MSENELSRMGLGAFAFVGMIYFLPLIIAAGFLFFLALFAVLFVGWIGWALIAVGIDRLRCPQCNGRDGAPVCVGHKREAARREHLLTLPPPDISTMRPF